MFPTLLSSKHFPIDLLLVLYLIIGLIIVVDYGESWDEQLHFMHFLSFLVGLFFFYLICLRFLNTWAAFGAVLLFSTQPLIWGHAFINPKDIPFMAFLLGSIALGLRMIDVIIAGLQPENYDLGKSSRPDSSLIKRLTAEWREQNQKTKIFSGLTIGIAVLILIGLLTFREPIHQSLADLIRQAYFANPSTLSGSLFTSLAENVNAVSPESYIQKGLILSDRLVVLYAVVATGLSILAIVRTFPRTTKWLWDNSLKAFLKAIPASAANPSLIGASIFFGLCMSIRTLGPFAGFLIAITFLLKAGRKAWPALIAYFAIALIIAYLTWPNLWEAPLGNYLKSLTEASDYPWEGKVLFNG